MPIGLTAKIEPLNDGFVGMVDADQIIGASGNGGYLPSSAISANILDEYQLMVSNSPTDGHYLQYKDASDRLTWAAVAAGDTSGQVTLLSGLSLTVGSNLYHDGDSTGLYIVSANQYSQAYDHSSNTSIHYVSSSLYPQFYPSSLGNSLNTSYTGHSSNSDIHFTKESLDDDYYPSSAGNSLSTSYTGHSSNADIHYPSSQMEAWFDGLYAPSGVSGDTSSQVTLSSGLTSDDNIYHDGVATDMFLQNIPQGVILSGSKYYEAYLHSSSSDNPHDVSWSDVSSSASHTDLQDIGSNSHSVIAVSYTHLRAHET